MEDDACAAPNKADLWRSNGHAVLGPWNINILGKGFSNCYLIVSLLVNLCYTTIPCLLIYFIAFMTVGLLCYFIMVGLNSVLFIFQFDWIIFQGDILNFFANQFYQVVSCKTGWYFFLWHYFIDFGSRQAWNNLMNIPVACCYLLQTDVMKKVNWWLLGW